MKRKILSLKEKPKNSGIAPELREEYYSELRLIDSFNPFKADREYLELVRTYKPKVEEFIAQGERNLIFAVSTFMTRLAQEHKGDSKYVWLAYDVVRYLEHRGGLEVDVNDVAYDPYVRSLVITELRKTLDYSTIIAIALPMAHKEMRRVMYFSAIESDGSLDQKQDSLLLLGKAKRSCSMILTELAFAYIKSHQAHKALPFLEFLKAQSPDDGVVYDMMAQALLEQGNALAALSQVEQSIHLSPNRDASYGLKAKILIDLGRNKEALEVLQASFLDQANPFVARLRVLALENLKSGHTVH